MQYDFDTSWLTNSDREIIADVQTYCANLNDEGKSKTAPDGDGAAWDASDGEYVAGLLNRSTHPSRLFRWMDEKTGHSSVGYETRDGREWFHILRQMRNTPGSGLLENLDRPS